MSRENVHGEVFVATGVTVRATSKIASNLDSLGPEVSNELVAPMFVQDVRMEIKRLLHASPKFAWPCARLCSLFPLLDQSDKPLAYNALASKLGVTLDSHQPPDLPHVVQRVYGDLMQRLNDVHLATGFEPQHIEFASQDVYFAWRDTEIGEIQKF